MEVALYAPWIFFLLGGALDAGFYEVALISAQNAAREAVQYTSKSSTTLADSTTACTMVREEMASLPNVSGLSSCGSSPLIVTASSVTGPDGGAASEVSVTYTSGLLIPIPWLMKNMTVTRSVQMRQRYQ
jgi:hypothetical protein